MGISNRVIPYLMSILVMLTLINSISSLDFNAHLERINKSYFDESHKTVKVWSDVNNLLKTVVSNLINPNMFGLYEVEKKIGLSSDCIDDINKIGKDLANGKRWAVEMADANSKLPSGILEGTVMEFGSMEECLRIKVNERSWKSDKEVEKFRGRYCQVGFSSDLFQPLYKIFPDGRNYTETYGHPPEWIEELLKRSAGYMKSISFWFGICLPSTCSQEDVYKITSAASKILGFKATVKDCQVDEPFVWPQYSLVAVSVLGCLVGLCITGTLLDVICRWRKSDPTHSEDDHVLIRIPKAFSVLANTETLFCRSGGGGCLGFFNGIRFLSATWIVLGHTYFYNDTWKYLKYRRLLGLEEEFNRYLPLAVIENFTVPVGSFFFMSGFLLVYTTWKQLEKNSGKLNILMFIVHKYWRMTPSLCLMLALFFALPVIDSGPLWNSTLEPPLKQCLNLWWANILYINNFWRSDEFCLIHTWYLGALMQFHIIGIVILLVIYRWPVVGYAIASLTTVACVIVTGLLVAWNNFPMPAYGLVKDVALIEDYHSRVYVKPFAHFASYMIGMVVAGLVLKYRGKRLEPKYRLIGWILAVAAASSSVYGLYGPAESLVIRVLYIACFRMGWALGIGWLTYVCATGSGGKLNNFLSWNAFSSLGQLSYLTYLLHPLVIIYRNASLRERVYYGHTELVFSFISNLVVAVFMAYGGYVVVEIPFSILEKIIFKSRSKPSTKNVGNEYSTSAHYTKKLNP